MGAKASASKTRRRERSSQEALAYKTARLSSTPSSTLTRFRCVDSPAPRAAGFTLSLASRCLQPVDDVIKTMDATSILCSRTQIRSAIKDLITSSCASQNGPRIICTVSRLSNGVQHEDHNEQAVFWTAD